MNNLRLLFTTAFLWFGFISVAGAQFIEDEIPPPDYRFGVIPASLFEIQPDHDYPFEYLLKDSYVNFREDQGSIKAIIQYLVRIKVYTDDPVHQTEAALVGIPYYDSGNMETVTGIEGITHLRNGNKIPLNVETVRTVDLNSRYKIKEFEMPGSEKGAIIEYRYTITRRYIEELPDFYFSHRVPVRLARLKLRNEMYLRYGIVAQNTDFNVYYHEERRDTSNIPLVFTYTRPEPLVVEQWYARNIPPLETGGYVSAFDDLRGKLKFQIAEFGVPRQTLDNSWDLVAAQIRRTANPYEEVEKLSYLQNIGKQVMDELGNATAARDSLFRLVNYTMQFNNTASAFPNGSPVEVIEGEPADQATINMALLAMLRGAGIEANPLYISGRDFGRINKNFPSVYQFNRMLIYTETDGDEAFMDASYSHSMPDLIPVESFNEQGFIFSAGSHRWVDISPEKSLFDLDIKVVASLDSDGTLIGRIESGISGYPAREIRREMGLGTPANGIIRDIFLHVYPDAVVENAEILLSGRFGENVSVSFDFTLPEYAVTFTGALEFRPMVVGFLFENPFEETSRRVPITLDAPEKLNIEYEISLPAGFNREDIQEQYVTELNGAQLSEMYDVRSNILKYQFVIDISRKEFPADVYAQLRRLYERWVFLSTESWFIER